MMNKCKALDAVVEAAVKSVKDDVAKLGRIDESAKEASHAREKSDEQNTKAATERSKRARPQARDALSEKKRQKQIKLD